MFTLLIYFIYMLTLTNKLEKFKKNPLMVFGTFLPYAVFTVFVFIDPINHWLFYVNDAGEYVRGNYIFISYMISGLYLIVEFGYLVMHRSYLDTDKFIALSAIFPLTVIAIVAQLFTDGLLMEMYAMSISCVLIMFLVERPDEQIDYDTNFANLNAFIADGRRTFLEKEHVKIIILNVINEKKVNTLFGYDKYKEFRKTISRIINNTLENYKVKGICYSFGDGRYGIVLRKKYLDYALNVAEAVRKSLNGMIEINLSEFYTYTNSAIVECPNEITSVASCGDYIEKFSSEKKPIESTVTFADKEALKEFEIYSYVDGIIDRALEKRLFQIYYQPIYSINDKKYKSAEALIRLIDPDYGFISPGMFIPAAERSGKILQVGAYVLEEVCKFIASDYFKESGLEYIEVNLSVIQCMKDGISDDLLAILKKYNVDPAKINLEITESFMEISIEKMQKNLNKITESGITLSLDDYGTGYSNIERVAKLPISVIKFDKAFADAINNPKMEKIIIDTIAMFKHIDYRIVVEGVENKEMADTYSTYGCDFIQGFYFSKPLPLDDFKKFIDSHKNTNNY